MVVDNTDSLQVAIDNDGANVLKTMFLEVFRYLVGQIVSNDPFVLMLRINHRSAIGKIPNVTIKRAKLLLYFDKAAGIVDDGTYFSFGANHTRCIDDALHILLIKFSDLMSIESRKALSENFSFLHHQSPRQSTRHTLH